MKCAPVYLADIETNSHIGQIYSKGRSPKTLFKDSINKVSHFIKITLVA